MIVLAALALPAALGMAAIAVEGGLWYADHHQLRNMADAAALAAGWARREGKDELNASLAAIPPVGYDSDTDEIELISPPTTGAYAGDEQAIEVIARRTRPVLMSNLFTDSDSQDITARSIVRLQTHSSACVLVLDPTMASAMYVVGTAALNLVNCGITVNSNAPNAMNMVGTADVTDAWTEITGGLTMSGGAQLISPAPAETGVIPREDPYKDLPMPAAFGSCTKNDFIVNANATVTINPGRYCGGIHINSKAKVTMNPGTYIIDGGDVNINGTSTVNGSGVTILLSASGTDSATITVNGGATVNLTAPTTGTYKGLALVQDRNAHGVETSKLNGGSKMKIKGAMYFPAQALEFSGGDSTGAGCARIVAKSVKFTGNAALADNCAGLGLPEGMPDDPQIVG